MKKKSLPPKKIAPKGRPAPKEMYEDEEDGEPGEYDYGDEEGDEDQEGPQEDAAEGDGPGEEEQEETHEVTEDKLLAIMHHALGQLEQLQMQVHALHGGGAQGAAPQMGGMPGAAPSGVDPMQMLVRKAMG